MPDKLCTKCDGSGPFPKDRRRPDGLFPWCKTCVRENTAAHTAKNPERKKAADAAWRARNLESARQANRAYCREHAETRNAQHRGYYAKHREEQSARDARRYAANPETAKANVRMWRQRNTEAKRSIDNRRRARLAEAENTLTEAEWLAILEYFNYRCAYCLRSDVELTLDHVIAISRGGGHTAENVVPACRTDNCRKKDKPVFLMAG